MPPPASGTVISFEEKVDQRGRKYKQVISSKSFPGYEEAKSYIAKQGNKNYLIASASPFTSPMPLKPLQHYRLVYQSPATIPTEKGKTTPKVKIFEYTR